MQSSDAANSENYFLLNSGFDVTSIKASGNFTGSLLFNINSYLKDLIGEAIEISGELDKITVANNVY